MRVVKHLLLQTGRGTDGERFVVAPFRGLFGGMVACWSPLKGATTNQGRHGRSRDWAATSLLFLLLCLAAGLPSPSFAEFEDIDDVLLELDDAEGEERVELIKVLCKAKDEETASALVNVLLDPKPSDTHDVQQLVFQTLLHFKNAEIVPDLELALHGEGPQVKVYAIRLLARLLGPKSLDLIKGQLRAESLVRTAAIKAIGDCQHPQGRKLLERLLIEPGSTEDDHIFIRMSLVKLGNSKELPKLLESHQRLITTALSLENARKYIDTAAAKARNIQRTKFLWQLEKELRSYFTELPDSMIPILVETVETSAQNEGIQLVFELLPRLITPERCATFEPLLRSRFIGLRQLALHYFLKYEQPALKAAAVSALRKHLESGDWLDRRLALMYSSAFPDEERWELLRAATEDPIIWVRVEAVRELGKLGGEEAADVIEGVLKNAKEEPLRFTCRVTLAGLSEDLFGLR